MGLFEGVPVLREAEDAAGTVATGAVDTFVADPGNALLGVDAPNMGQFDQGSAVSQPRNLATGGLSGQSGLPTGGGQQSDRPPERGQQSDRPPERGQQLQGPSLQLILILAAILGGAYLLSRGSS